MANYEEEIFAFLGPNGAMISGSKSGYRLSKPNNLAIFNANVCILKETKVSKFWGLSRRTTTHAEKIWWGDLDITESRGALKNLAKEINATVIVLFEMNGRFDNESNPLWKEYVYKVTSDGDETIGSLLMERIHITEDILELIDVNNIILERTFKPSSI